MGACPNSLWLAHTTPLFISLKKLKIFDIYSYQLAIHMYRYHHDLPPLGLPNNHFPTQAYIHDYNTRQANDLHVDPTNTKLAQNNIKTQGPLTWNKLNIKIKNSPSLASFKTNLKKNTFLINMSSLPSILSMLQHHKFLFPMVFFAPHPAPSFDIQFFNIYFLSIS